MKLKLKTIVMSTKAEVSSKGKYRLNKNSVAGNGSEKSLQISFV